MYGGRPATQISGFSVSGGEGVPPRLLQCTAESPMGRPSSAVARAVSSAETAGRSHQTRMTVGPDGSSRHVNIRVASILEHSDRPQVMARTGEHIS